MIKQIKNLKGIFLGIFLLLSFISVAKVKVNIDGTVNIDFGKSRDRDRNGNGNNYWGNNNNNKNYYNVGDITDSQYILKPFIMNGKGYAVLQDYNRYYILQVDFHNGNLNHVKKEVVFNAVVQSSNCLSIADDNRYCLTITPKGQPALWDRYSSRIKYTGQWVKNNYNYDNDYDYDYYQNSNQSWFEW